MSYNPASWTTDQGSTTSLNLYVKSTSGADVPVPWTFTMYHPSYTGFQSFWNIQVKRDRTQTGSSGVAAAALSTL